MFSAFVFTIYAVAVLIQAYQDLRGKDREETEDDPICSDGLFSKERGACRQ